MSWAASVTRVLCQVQFPMVTQAQLSYSYISKQILAYLQCVSCALADWLCYFISYAPPSIGYQESDEKHLLLYRLCDQTDHNCCPHHDMSHQRGPNVAYSICSELCIQNITFMYITRIFVCTLVRVPSVRGEHSCMRRYECITKCNMISYILKYFRLTI